MGYNNPFDGKITYDKPKNSAVETAFSGKPVERAKFEKKQKELEEAAQQKLQAALPDITQTPVASAAAAPPPPPLAPAAQQKSQSQPKPPPPQQTMDPASATHSLAVDEGAKRVLARQKAKTWYNNPAWSKDNKNPAIFRYYTSDGEKSNELPGGVVATDEDTSLTGSILGDIKLPAEGGKKQRQPNNKNKNKNKNKKVSIKKNKKRAPTKKTRRNKKNKNKK